MLCKTNIMSLGKWQLKKDLNELCVKCTNLKPSTTKKYAKELFDKYEGDCISDYTEQEYDEKNTLKNNLVHALNTLKKGYIQSGNSILKLEDVSYVDFQENVIEITTKNKKVIRYGEGFKYLEYVFKYSSYY